MSTVINANRLEYYQQLRNTNCQLNITNWLVWFVDLVKKSQSKSLESVEFILQKSKFWAEFAEVKLNARQEKVMKKIFSVGADGFVRDGLSNEKYRAITGASSATATRDLKALVNNGLLRLTGEGKRGLRYFVNFPQQRDLFKPVENTKIIDNAALNKLLRKITRNIEYFRGEDNTELRALLNEYSLLADGNPKAQQ